MKSNAYSCAVSLLARREHGAHELVDKLIAKGYTPQDSDEALKKCQHLELQSDQRFVESRFRVRIRQGYGPRRIQMELQQLQIDPELIHSMLQQEAENWLEYGLAVWTKKYQKTQESMTSRDSSVDWAQGPTQISTVLQSVEKKKAQMMEQQKQKQFLHYRGFTSETIDLIFREITQ